LFAFVAVECNFFTKSIVPISGFLRT